MTREEAIEYLESWLEEEMAAGFDEDTYRIKSLRMAIEALTDRPHGRLIDAGYLERKYMEADYLDNDSAYYVIAEIDNAPTVSVGRPMGEWEHKPSKSGEWVWWQCSECGAVIYSETEADRKIHHAYCGVCGARMKGGAE